MVYKQEQGITNTSQKTKLKEIHFWTNVKGMKYPISHVRYVTKNRHISVSRKGLWIKIYVNHV